MNNISCASERDQAMKCEDGRHACEIRLMTEGYVYVCVICGAKVGEAQFTELQWTPATFNQTKWVTK